MFACEKEQKTDGFNIDVTLDSDINNSTARLFRVENNKKVVIDSAIVTKGDFSFKGKVDSPDKYYITIDNVVGNFPLIVANEHFSITIKSDSLAASKILGSKENDYANIFVEESQYLHDFNDSLSIKFKAFQDKNDTEGMAAVRKSYDSIVNEGLLFNISFIKKHPNATLSALTLERMTLANQIPEAQSKTLHKLLRADLKETRAAKAAMAFIEKNELRIKASKATTIGNVAPNFSAKTPQGETLSLSDIEAKVIIIDFWASWCAPCRQENPNIVRIYNKYHDKGLEIIGVSLDNPGQKARWVDAIEKDQLTWRHVSNLQGWNETIALQYGINSIPATFILDANNTIVAKDLRGQALEDKVAELLQ